MRVKEELPKMSGLGKECFDSGSISSPPLIMHVCFIDAGDVYKRRCDGLQSEDTNARLGVRGQAWTIISRQVKWRRPANRSLMVVETGDRLDSGEEGGDLKRSYLF